MQSANHIRKEITVVGGFYREICQFPDVSLYFGSGGRAAVAMANKKAQVRLATMVDDQSLDELKVIEQTFGIRTQHRKVDSIFQFVYMHPLSKPVFYGPKKLPRRPLCVKADAVLCFGMMEGRPIVHGNQVVYDPQSHNEAEPFSSNGSSAKNLAIVANHSEAKTLTKESDEEKAAMRLRKLEKAEVAVVKCGPRGAIVATSEKVTRIAAYQVDSVFKLGSGDVFSSMFAYFWIVENMAPELAAKNASRATAYYCKTQTLPIPHPLPRNFKPRAGRGRSRRKRFYLAGPFFTPQQLWMIEECRNILYELGHDVFSPFHDVGRGAPEDVAWPDLKGLQKCDEVFAVLDGFDSGTLFEIGYAVREKIPVKAVYHGSDKCPLTMLMGTGCQVYPDISSAIYAAAY